MEERRTERERVPNGFVTASKYTFVNSVDLSRADEMRTAWIEKVLYVPDLSKLIVYNNNMRYMYMRRLFWFIVRYVSPGLLIQK